MSDFEASFWGKTDRTGGDCWRWLGALNNGHPKAYVPRETLDGVEGGKYVPAAKVALALSGQEWPDKTVRHTCGNVLCVNPSHLTTDYVSRAASPADEEQEFIKRAVDAFELILSENAAARWFAIFGDHERYQDNLEERIARLPWSPEAIAMGRGPQAAAA